MFKTPTLRTSQSTTSCPRSSQSRHRSLRPVLSSTPNRTTTRLPRHNHLHPSRKRLQQPTSACQPPRSPFRPHMRPYKQPCTSIEAWCRPSRCTTCRVCIQITCTLPRSLDPLPPLPTLALPLRHASQRQQPGLGSSNPTHAHASLQVQLRRRRHARKARDDGQRSHARTCNSCSTHARGRGRTRAQATQTRRQASQGPHGRPHVHAHPRRARAGRIYQSPAGCRLCQGVRWLYERASRRSQDPVASTPAIARMGNRRRRFVGQWRQTAQSGSLSPGQS